MTRERSSAATFSLLVHARDTCHVVALTGELDISTVSRMRHAFDDLIRNGARYAVVDLSGLTFMDSAGLGALLALHRRLRVLRGAMAVVAEDGGRVARVITLTGLHHVLRTFDTLEAAVAALDEPVRGADER